MQPHQPLALQLQHESSQQQLLPPHWWDGQPDPALPVLSVVRPGEQLGRAPRYVMSNSFAFGGSNAVLVFAAAPTHTH